MREDQEEVARPIHGDREREPPPPLPAPPAWRRLAQLLRPGRRGLALMLAGTAAGSALAVVPPLLAGRFIGGLATGHGAAGYGAAMAAATVLSAGLYAASDGIRAVTGGRFYTRLREQMLAGALRLAQRGVRSPPGVVSRFISDAELLEGATVGALDAGALAGFELIWALVALGILDPLALAAAICLMVAAAAVIRVAQRPVADAGSERQERLEQLTAALGEALARPQSPAHGATAALDASRRADVRLGICDALNRHLSGALAELAPLAVTIVAALHGDRSVADLLSVLLVSERSLQAADAIADVAVDLQSVRGATRRCLALADAALSAG